MLEEEIKRLTVAVLDLTAVLREMTAYANDNLTPTAAVERAMKEITERQAVTPAPASAAAKAYADVEEIAEAHAEVVAQHTATEFTADDARKALIKVAALKGKDAAMAVLQRFSAEKVTQLAPQHWPEFIAACEGALS